MQKVFDSMDLNKNGLISREELVSALQRLGLGHDHAEIMDLFDKFGASDANAINFDEFVAFVSSREHEIRHVFNELDTNGSGTLCRDEISQALDRIHMRYTNDELRSLISRMDQNNDSTVTYEEFRHFVMILPSINIRAIWNAHRVHDSIDIGEDMTVPDESSSRSSKPQDYWKSLVAGGVAGLVSRTATAPADRLKIMFQAGVKINVPPPVVQPTLNLAGAGAATARSISSAAAVNAARTRSPSLLEVSRMIYAEGGWRAFFRGNGTNGLKIAPESATKFFTYERLKRAVARDPDHPVVLERLVAGAGAGVVSQTVIYPLEVAKTRLALANTGEYRGIYDCLSSIVRREGIGAWFRGLNASLTGVIPYAGVDLAVYNTIRDTYSEYYSGRTPSPMVILASGAFSSICGQVIAFPLQCVRTKLQAQGMPGRPVRYASMGDCFRQTIAEEGVRGLYRGILPNFLKAVPAVSISYLVYEHTKARL